MCPPTHFKIVYQNNAFMAEGMKAWAEDPAAASALAHKQWAALRQKLEQLGARISLVEPSAQFPDQVFTADGGIAFTKPNGEKAAFISHFSVSERQGEEQSIEESYRKLGYKIVKSPADFEGFGETQWDQKNKVLWVGHGHRSHIDSHKAIAETMGVKLISLELKKNDNATQKGDIDFFHLDTCFVPLASGHCVIYPAALSDNALTEISKIIPKEKWIIIDKEDAAAFGCNLVEFNNNLIMPDGISAGLEAKLCAIGYSVHKLDLSMYILSGGAAHCLTQPTHIKLSLPKPATASKNAAVHPTTLIKAAGTAYYNHRN